MPGEHLDAVRELEEPPQRVEEALGALHRAHCEIGPRRVADEQRVAGEHEPRLVRARRVRDGEAAVLRPVPGCVDAAERHAPDDDLRSVGERLARVLGLRERVDTHGDAVVEREPPVTRDVVGVRVRLERPHDPRLEALGLGENRLDREMRVDDHDLSRLLAADEVRGAPEVVVEDLREEHGRRP